MRRVLTVLLATGMVATVVRAREGKEVVSVKAASPVVNCGCQCSSLTFRDKWGEVQGNCRR